MANITPDTPILRRLQNLPQDLKKLSLEECDKLCAELRTFIIATVSETGGHLASSLGTVELTVAMHRVFSSPNDKFIWDVGHQCYAHKILTGRLDQFHTLRQEGGIAGFPKPQESPHDPFISGHSSTAVSVALGFAEGMRLNGDSDHFSIAIVGDGAMTGGLFYEAMNNAGKTGDNLIVILNDNGMSISKNVGAFAHYLSSMRSSSGYVRTKKAVEQRLNQGTVVGPAVEKILRGSKNVVRETLLQSATMFEDFGFVYLGPVDGHNIGDIEDVLRAAKEYRKPVFVHLRTVKGKGYSPAEENPGKYHGVTTQKGKQPIGIVEENSYSDVFGKELTHLAAKDTKICAITAAMEHGTGLQYFSRMFPKRYYDVGIAEGHAVTFSAALAAAGRIPVFAVYSSFLQRSYDQLLHDVSISGQHVVLAIDRAGVVGEDGETHQGLYDVSFLSSIPGTVIYSPACYEELKLCLSYAIYQEEHLACVRYPRGRDTSMFDKSHLNVTYTHTTQTPRSDTLYITYGRIYDALYRANLKAKAAGLGVDMLKLTRIFPLFSETIEIALSYQHIVFLEESYYYGGISQLFGDALLQHGYTGTYRRVAATEPLHHASVASQLEKIGLSETAIYHDIFKHAMEGKAS